MTTRDDRIALPLSGAATTPRAGASGADLPDRAEFWRWVWDSVRPLLGWVLTGLGLLALFISWYEVSGTAVVAKQIPYLVSGGLLGVGLIALGGRSFLIEDLRRDSGRLDRLEQMVGELHLALLNRADAPDPQALLAPRPELNGSGELRVLPSGTTFHRADCPMLVGKDRATTIRPETAVRRGLAPCPLCEPSPVSA